jgi:hypothetical protein
LCFSPPVLFDYASSFSTILLSVPSREFFGPSKLFLSGQQRLQDIRGRTLVPRGYSFRASSAFEIFELYLSGQQRLRDIRGRTLVPRSYPFRASSAFEIFEVGLWSLEAIPFGPAAPSRYSRFDFGPSKLSLSGQQRLRDIRGRISDL